MATPVKSDALVSLGTALPPLSLLYAGGTSGGFREPPLAFPPE
jgi:hypothetical protein